MPRKAKSASTAPLSGITVAVSGKLSLDRKKLTALVEGAGGAVASSVTKKVTHLITTDDEIGKETQKVIDARKSGIFLVSEDFLHDSIKKGKAQDASHYLLDSGVEDSSRKRKTRGAKEDSDEEEEAPKGRAKKAGKKAGGAAKKAGRGKKAEEESDDEDAKAPVAKGRGKKVAATEEVDDDEMDVDDVPSGRAKKTGGTAKKAGRGKRAAKEDDDTEAVPAVKESTPVADKVNAEEAKAEKPTLTTSASTVGAGRLGNHNVEVVFSFDTTGSMYPCLTQVRRKIQEATERLFKEAPNIRIGIIAHGDYCDERSSYVIKSLDLTNDKSKIVKFVEEVGPTGGGDAPECYELVLRDCQKLSWTAGYNHALVLIGDDLPHEKGANPHGISWQEEAKRCGEQGILIYAVQALNRNYAARFYTTIAQSSGGVHLNLDQFSAVTDLLIAICYRERAPEQLEIFEKEVIAQGRYNRGVRKMFDAMIGRSSIATTDKENLNAVTPGRFQVLNVDRDCAIKDFVQENGAAFKPGRGFYEFTKAETVQKYKEIILMDKNGDMFEGKYARELLNLPDGADAKIKPGEYDFVVFVQSTSNNRKLIGGTRFLYEVDDWDRS